MSKPCRWCMRYDCKEKGGSIEQCPMERKESYDQYEMTKLQHNYLKEKTPTSHGQSGGESLSAGDNKGGIQ